MAKGNPNPKISVATQFGKPGGPKPGKTSLQRKTELTTAEMAALNAHAAIRIRAKLLEASEARLAAMTPDQIAMLIEPAMLKLLTDSETRGLGAPVQPVDHSSTDGSMTPRALDATKLSTEALREIMGAVGDQAAEPDAS